MEASGGASAMNSDVRFTRIKVRMDEPIIVDVSAHTDAALAASGVSIAAGAEVAIAIGSRGIADLVTVVQRVVLWVRDRKSVV